MRCKANYRGIRPVFGVEKNHTYTLEITTRECLGTQFMWVRVQELPEYMIPYENIVALLTEWDFLLGDDQVYLRHLDLVDRWLDVYTPAEVKV